MIQFSQRMKLSSLSVSSWLISWFTPPLLTNEKCKFTVWFTLKQCYFLLHFWSMTIYVIPKCSILQILQSQQIVSYTTDSRRGGFGWVTSKNEISVLNAVFLVKFLINLIFLSFGNPKPLIFNNRLRFCHFFRATVSFPTWRIRLG